MASPFADFHRGPVSRPQPLFHFSLVPLVCRCAPHWIILGTLLLCSRCRDRLAGKTSISLKCGSTRSIKTLSMAASLCPRSEQCYQICHPGRRTSQGPHLQPPQSMQSPPLPTQHLPLGPQWPRKNHEIACCMSKRWAQLSVLALAANPLGWILPVLPLHFMGKEVDPCPGRIRTRSINNAHCVRRPLLRWIL